MRIEARSPDRVLKVLYMCVENRFSASTKRVEFKQGFCFYMITVGVSTFCSADFAAYS